MADPNALCGGTSQAHAIHIEVVDPNAPCVAEPVSSECFTVSLPYPNPRVAPSSAELVLILPSGFAGREWRSDINIHHASLEWGGAELLDHASPEWGGAELLDQASPEWGGAELLDHASRKGEGQPGMGRGGAS